MPVEGWAPDETFALPNAGLGDESLLLGDSGALENAFFDSADARWMQAMTTPGPAAATRSRRSLRQLQRSATRPHHQTLRQLSEQEETEDDEKDDRREATPTPALPRPELQQTPQPKPKLSLSSRDDSAALSKDQTVASAPAREHLKEQPKEPSKGDARALSLDPEDPEQTPRASRASRRAIHASTKSSRGVRSPESGTGLHPIGHKPKRAMRSVVGQTDVGRQQVQNTQNQDRLQKPREVELAEIKSEVESSSAARLPRASCAPPSSPPPPGIKETSLSLTAEYARRSDIARRLPKERISACHNHEVAKLSDGHTYPGSEDFDHRRVSGQSEADEASSGSGIHTSSGTETRDARSRSQIQSRSPARAPDRGERLSISKHVGPIEGTGRNLKLVETVDIGADNGLDGPHACTERLTKPEGESGIKQPLRKKAEGKSSVGPEPAVVPATSTQALTAARSSKVKQKKELPESVQKAKLKRTDEVSEMQPVAKKAKRSADEETPENVTSELPNAHPLVLQHAISQGHAEPGRKEQLNLNPYTAIVVTAQSDEISDNVTWSEPQATNSMGSRSVFDIERAEGPEGNLEDNLMRVSPQGLNFFAECEGQAATNHEGTNSDEVQDFLARYAKKYGASSDVIEKLRVSSTSIKPAEVASAKPPLKRSEASNTEVVPNEAATKQPASDHANERPAHPDSKKGNGKKPRRPTAPKIHRAPRSKPATELTDIAEESSEHLQSGVKRGETVMDGPGPSRSDSSTKSSVTREGRLDASSTSTRNAAAVNAPTSANLPQDRDSAPNSRLDGLDVPAPGSKRSGSSPDVKDASATAWSSTSEMPVIANGTLKRTPWTETIPPVDRKSSVSPLDHALPRAVERPKTRPKIKPKDLSPMQSAEGSSRPRVTQADVPFAGHPVPPTKKKSDSRSGKGKEKGIVVPQYQKPSSDRLTSAVVDARKSDVCPKTKPRADDMFERKKRDNYLQKGVDLSAHSSSRFQHQSGEHGAVHNEVDARQALSSPGSAKAAVDERPGSIETDSHQSSRPFVAARVSEGAEEQGFGQTRSPPNLEIDNGLTERLPKSSGSSGALHNYVEAGQAIMSQGISGSDGTERRRSEAHSDSDAKDPTNTSTGSLGGAITERIVNFGQRLMDTLGLLNSQSETANDAMAIADDRSQKRTSDKPASSTRRGRSGREEESDLHRVEAALAAKDRQKSIDRKSHGPIQRNPRAENMKSKIYAKDVTERTADATTSNHASDLCAADPGSHPKRVGRKRTAAELLELADRQNDISEGERYSKRSRTSRDAATSFTYPPASSLHTHEAIDGVGTTPAKKTKVTSRGLLASVKKAKAKAASARRRDASQVKIASSNAITEASGKSKFLCGLTVPEAPTFASELLRQQRTSATSKKQSGMKQQAEGAAATSHRADAVASSQSRTRIQFTDKQETLGTAKSTVPHSFQFEIDSRLTRRREFESKLKAWEKLASSSGGSGAAHHLVSRKVLPDFKGLHAAQEANLAQMATRRREFITPTLPVTPHFLTDNRVIEREKFDEARRAREKEAERLREEQRRLREEEEEREQREARKRAVPHANAVPEWYADAPKKYAAAQ